MFAEYSEPTWVWESIDVSSLIAEAFESHDEQFQCFMETANVSIMYETSSITTRFTQIIEGIIHLIRKAIAQFIAGLDVAVRRTEALIRKYEPQLKALTDDDLAGIEYDNVTYTIYPAVPGDVDLSIIDWALKQMSSVITRDTMTTIRERVDVKVPFIRGQMMGKSSPVSDAQIDSTVKTLFKNPRLITEIPLTKEILERLLSDLKMYSSVRSSVERNGEEAAKTLSKYKKLINSIYSEQYTPDENKLKVTVNGVTSEASANGAVYHREAQMYLTNVVLELTSLYSTLINEKLIALKDKFEHDQLMLRAVIVLIQDGGRK